MPVNQSFGVFPSQSAIRSKSTGDLNDLYFKTTYSHGITGRTLPANERVENFDQVHSIGKRSTKYMKYQKNTAPLLDRNACRHTQTYHALPLGDNVVNRELAKTFKGHSQIAASPSFGLTSNYGDNFVGHYGDVMRSAKLPSCKSKQVRTQTLGGTGDMLEQVSSQHKDHSAPPKGMSALAGQIVLPKGNISLQGQGQADLFKSQYHRDFKIPKGQKGLTEAEWQECMPPAPSWVVQDGEIYRTRRACFMSPGN